MVKLMLSRTLFMITWQQCDSEWQIFMKGNQIRIGFYFKLQCISNLNDRTIFDWSVNIWCVFFPFISVYCAHFTPSIHWIQDLKIIYKHLLLLHLLVEWLNNTCFSECQNFHSSGFGVREGGRSCGVALRYYKCNVEIDFSLY